VEKFPNGYEGPFQRKGQSSEGTQLPLNADDPPAAQSNDYPITSAFSSAVNQHGEPPALPNESMDEQIADATRTQMDANTEPGGLFPSLGASGSEVRFGESAISPMSGSEAGVLQTESA
jgi:hypothetical protein